MIISIDYPSAKQFWLNSCNQPLIEWIRNHSNPISLPRDWNFKPSRETAVKLADQFHLSLPVSFLVSREEKRIRSNYYKCRVLSINEPEYGFISVNLSPDNFDNTCLVLPIPEYCFVRAAADLPFHEAALLGYDFCSRYITDRNKKYNHISRNPLTTVRQLTDFVNHADGIRGVLKSRQIIKYILDNSNSPMENRLALMAVLPLSKGGFGIKAPVLNAEVPLSVQAIQEYGKRTCCCDLFWPEEKLVVEYDSNQTHLTSSQHWKDKSRISALSLSGYTVNTITTQDIRSIASLEEKFASIRYVLGMRNRNYLLDQYRDRRITLFHNLMDF